MIVWILGAAFAGTTVIAPGDDWCGAINAAAGGNEVVLGAGEHAGPCNIANSGAAGAPVTLQGETGARIVYSGSSSNVIDVNGDHVVISGLEIGPSNPNIDGIKIKSNGPVEVLGNVFREVGGISVSANSSNTTGIRIVGNAFYDLRATGIYLGCHEGECSSDDYLIADNLFDGVTSSAIGYAMEMKVNSWGTVRDNVIHDTKGPGIEVYGANDPSLWTTVEGNLVVGSTNNGTVEIGGGPALVRNNVVIGGAEGAIYAYDYGGRGLQRSVHIVGNTVVGDGGPAIRLSSWDGGTDLVLANNAAWQRAGGSPAIPGPIPGATMEGNHTCDAACWADPDAWDFAPVLAALSESGVSGSDLPADFCGETRADPPVIGAIEGSGPGPMAVDFKATFACAPAGTDPGDTSDTGVSWENPPDTDDVASDDTDAPNTNGELDPKPCGCTSPGSPNALWPLLFPFLALIPRRPHQRATIAPGAPGHF